MKNALIKYSSVLMLTLGIQACSTEQTDSVNIDSEGIWAGIEIVSADGQGSSINVELNVGGSNGTNLNLSSGDSLVVVTSAGSVTLNRDTDFLDIDYEGELSVGGSDELIQVNFVRQGAEDVTGSNVNLPDSFVVDFPQNNMTFTDLTDFEIVWTEGTSGNIIELTQRATCKNALDEDVVLSESTNVSDDGSFTSDFLSKLTGIINDKGCDLRIIFERAQNGDLADGFGEGGYIRAKQRRDVTDMRVDI